jgi:CRISPR-associated protein Csh2
MGKDFRIKYALLGFHGIISGFNAKNTRLSETDVELLDTAILKSIPLHATRSKVGQEPRLYLRVEYTSDDFILGDFRKWITCKNNNDKKDDELFSVKDVILDIKPLLAALDTHQDRIAKIVLWKDDTLAIEGNLESLSKTTKPSL